MNNLKSNYQKTIEYIMEQLDDSFDNIIGRYSYKGTIDDAEMVRKTVTTMVENTLENEIIVSVMNSLIILDKNIVEHSVNVAILSTILGLKSQMNYKSLEYLTIASFLHDMGKAYIFSNNTIMADPSYKYNKKDKIEIKKHPLIAYKKLSEKENEFVNIPTPVKRSILLANAWQKPDYSYNKKRGEYLSYPLYFEGKKLEGHKDPVSEILQVTNFFDSCIRKGYTASQALLMIDKRRGYQFTNTSADIITECISPYCVGDGVQLNTGEKAIVTSQTSDPLRPLIRLLSGKELTDNVINLLENTKYLITNMVCNKGVV